MAYRETEVKLSELHAAIAADIAAAFPEFATVKAYPMDREELNPAQVPALFFELSEMPVGDLDPGSEQWSTDSQWEARIIVGFRDGNPKLTARIAAANFAAWLHRKRHWSGMKGGPITVTGAYPDDFDPQLDQYEVWRVEWSQILHIGASIWKPDEPVEFKPYYAYEPEVGQAHEDDYMPVAPE